MLKISTDIFSASVKKRLDTLLLADKREASAKRLRLAEASPLIRKRPPR